MNLWKMGELCSKCAILIYGCFVDNWRGLFTAFRTLSTSRELGCASQPFSTHILHFALHIRRMPPTGFHIQTHILYTHSPHFIP